MAAEEASTTMNLIISQEEEASEVAKDSIDHHKDIMILMITNKIDNINSHRENSENKDLLDNSTIDHLTTGHHVEISMEKEEEEAVGASEATTEVASEVVIEEASEVAEDKGTTIDQRLESLLDS